MYTANTFYNSPKKEHVKCNEVSMGQIVKLPRVSIFFKKKKRPNLVGGT